MAKLAELRKEAKELGIAAAVIRGASSASELQTIISDHSNGNGSKGKKAAKGAVKAAKKGKATKASASKKASTKNSKADKPKNSKKSASSKSAPAKSSKGTAKRRATASDSDAGRHMLGTIDYSETEGWNPREGSTPDRIHKALKKFKGNRDKVFSFLVENLWDFVPKKTQDGTKRSKSEAENLLRFRIAQTDWRFAIQTGQHEKSENRAEYGSGGNSTKTKAPAKRGRPAKAKVEEKPKRGRPAKAKATDKPKRGRPAGSKNKAKAEAPKRGRGRPKGSKNKK